VEGVGTHEAPRGTLSHWVVVKNGRLANYQAVVPTTWNVSPRDNKGQPWPYEASLLGNPRGGSREAVGTAAHGALFRSLHGLCLPYHGSRGQTDRHRQSPVISRVLIAGIGNLLLQDDGLGPQAVARLQSEYEFGAEVGVLDIDFVDYLRGRDVLVLIDALSGGGEPGEILTFDKERLKGFLPNMRLSAHQPCLNETLHTAETAGIDLKEVLLVGVVGHSFDVGTDLGPYVSKVLPEVLELVADVVWRHGLAVEKRALPLPMRGCWEAESPVEA
jgi:hydrogenase maturation protease